MLISHSFDVNEENHVVLENGVELGMPREQYMYTQLLQDYDMEILLAIDEFCRKHGITYYLAEGTLLGAIRHGGFIPWDDDVDICMMRDDYERFLKLAAEDFPEEYAIDCPLTNDRHWTILSQVEIKRTVPYLKQRLQGIALYNGPCVDVFPVDYVETDDVRELTKRDEKIQRLRRAMWIKSGLHNRKWYRKFSNRIRLFYPLKLYGMTRSMEALRSEVFSLMRETDDPGSPFVANFASLYPVEKEVFPREWFGEPRMVEFEGYPLPCPAESEKILTKTYNNYKAMPAIRDRSNKHFFSSNEELLNKIDDQEVVNIVRELQAQRRIEEKKEAEELRLLKEQGLAPLSEDPPAIRAVKRHYGRAKAFLLRRAFDIQSQVMQGYLDEDLQKKTVLFDAFNGLGILDSPRAIFKRMLEREEFRDYHFIWTVSSNNTNKKLTRQNIREFSGSPNVTTVLRSSRHYAHALATSEYLVTNSSFPDYFARRPDQYYLNTWHGVPTKVMGYERPGQKVISTRNVVRNFLNATHIVSANDFTAETMFKRAYKLEGLFEGKLLNSPLPRTDAIYNTSREYILKKLAEEGIPTDKKIILYAPTWKGDNFKDIKEDTDELRDVVKTIQKRIDSDEYIVLLRVHYFLYRSVGRDEELKRLSVPFTIDTNELLSVTDVLISDYSSIFFDFLGTRRPILFYVPDLEEYKENRGLYIPMEDMPGPVAMTAEEIAWFINDLDHVKEQYHDKYTEMWQWCSSREDGGVVDRIIDDFFLKKDMEALDCRTGKTRLLIMAEWFSDFPARNGVEHFLHTIDYDKYDVTLLAGNPRGRVMRGSLEKLDPHVRVLIDDRKIYVSRSKRKKVYDGIEDGTVTLDQAYEALKMDREWRRQFGDAKFDELMVIQPENRSFQFWYIMMTYAPVKKRSFIVSSSGLQDLYKDKERMKDFHIYQTIDEYRSSL